MTNLFSNIQSAEDKVSILLNTNKNYKSSKVSNVSYIANIKFILPLEGVSKMDTGHACTLCQKLTMVL